MEHSNRLRLLIVEEGAWFQELLQNVPDATARYQVAGCASGEEAIGLLEREKFDFIILDDTIPAGSGLNLLHWRQEQKHDIPVIILTATASADWAAAAMQHGASECLNKERLALDQLPALINEVRERHLFRQEHEQRMKTATAARQQDIMARYQQAVETIALSVNTSLSILLSEAKEYEDHFNDLRQASPGSQEFYSREASAAFREFHQHTAAVAAGVRSLVALTNLVFSKYAAPEGLAEINHDLEESLKLLNQ